jgi:hypothetical protein
MIADPDPQIATTAIYASGTSAAAEPALRAALSSGSEDVRRVAAMQLRRRSSDANDAALKATIDQLIGPSE